MSRTKFRVENATALPSDFRVRTQTSHAEQDNASLRVRNRTWVLYFPLSAIQRASVVGLRVQVSELYQTTFAQLRTFPQPTAAADVERFEALLLKLKLRHTKMVPMMSAAVNEADAAGHLTHPSNTEYINKV